MTVMTQHTTFRINLWKTPILGPLVFAFWKVDAARKLRWMNNWLPFMGSHVEIGSGPGSVLDVMRAQNYDVDGLDVRDSSYREDLRPVLYNGKDMPFCKHAYDTALLPTVLHHTADPEYIITEAARVSKRVIIIEDVYEGRIMEWLTKALDSLMNLEFLGHPHSNRTDKEWQETFERLGLSIQHKAIYRIGGIFKQAVYVLEPRKAL
ncbi:MAG: methyltransferase domain-containing protein [Litorimonas sp.]